MSLSDRVLRSINGGRWLEDAEGLLHPSGLHVAVRGGGEELFTTVVASHGERSDVNFVAPRGESSDVGVLSDVDGELGALFVAIWFTPIPTIGFTPTDIIMGIPIIPIGIPITGIPPDEGESDPPVCPEFRTRVGELPPYWFPEVFQEP